MELSRAPTNTVNWSLTKEQKNIMEQSQLLQQNVLEQLDPHMQKKINVETDLTLLIKINWKWLTGLNIKLKTMEFLEDNIEENLDGIGYDNDLLITKPKPWSMKEITDKLISSKLEASALQKTMSREWEDKDKPKTRRKYLQKTYVTKAFI